MMLNVTLFQKVAQLSFIAALTTLILPTSLLPVADADDPPATQIIPQSEISNERLNDALKRAGNNRNAVVEFITNQSKQKREAAEFLVANMPTVDLVSMSLIDMQTNLDVAFQARDTQEWIGELPFNIFLHYVVPSRITQEPFEPWRQYYFEALESQLKDCTNMIDAAIAVNQWCGARVGFKQTERRDQSGMSTLRSGIGRCEEMMIVTIEAMRAVSIPARACSAPWWVTTDNNHAWVEVWADGQWYYLGGCEPAAALDRGWFSGAAQRAGMVLSQMYGSPDEYPTGEVVCRTWDNMAIINSTSVYAMTGEVEITVVNNDGTPIPDCPVSAAVFNFGGLRPLNIQTTDESGKTTFVMGLGEYFYTTGLDEYGKAHAVIKTLPASAIKHTMMLDPDNAPEESFWLRYPTVAEAKRWAGKRDKGASEAIAVYCPDLIKPDKKNLFEEGKNKQLDSMIEHSNHKDQWHSILNDSYINWHNIAATVIALPDVAYQDAARVFLTHTSRVDRLEMKPETITDHVLITMDHKPDSIDTDMFNEYVLNARIDYEHLSPWRELLYNSFENTNNNSPETTARALSKWIDENLTSESSSRLGPVKNPAQVFNAKYGTKREFAIFAVGVLRALSIPAKKSSARNTVEFYDGKSWVIFTPGDPDSFKLVGSNDDIVVDTEKSNSEAEVDLHGTIRVHLTRNDETLGNDFHGLDIAPFRRGSWNPFNSYDYHYDEDAHIISLPAGEYLLTAGVRNPNGDPYVRTKLIQLKSGANIQVNWNMDLPDNAGVFSFPIVRKLENFPEDIRLHNRKIGESINISSMHKDSPLLLYFFRMGDEPSIRMLPLINDAIPALQEVGVRVIGIALPTPIDISLESFLSQNPAEFPVYEAGSDVGLAFGLNKTEPMGLFQPLPSVLLTQRDGNVIMWADDLNLNINTLLKDAARQVK